MRLYERECTIPKAAGHAGLIDHLARHIGEQLAPGEWPIRVVVAETAGATYRCEVGLLHDPGARAAPIPLIFEFRRRPFESADRFNVVLLVPTGVHATIGGHAGDAGPVARLLAGVADTLVTHPNVVNGSDINELPENGLYVEGSLIARMLMGTAGLLPVRSNRVLLAIDRHPERAYTSAAINALNAARACYGLDGARVVVLDPPVRLVSEYTASGRAAGRVDNFGDFVAALAPHAPEYDALAISSVIAVPPEFHQDYFDSGGSMVNPWGGVEAIFTHALSLSLGRPTAHAPMIESEEIEAADPGIVDPRLAAEAVSYTFLQSVLKGLTRAPRVVTDPAALAQSAVLTARDIAALVTPDGCLGLPVLAALEQGIRVIAVRDEANLMRNDLSALPWAPGQFCVAENYFEAAGVLLAWKQGLALDTLRRPIHTAPVSEFVRPRRKANRNGSGAGTNGAHAHRAPR
jgi:hypothetical protein